MDGLVEEYMRRGEPSLTVALPPEVVIDLGLDVTYSEPIDGKEMTFCGVSVVEREAMLRDHFVAGGYYVTEDPGLRRERQLQAGPGSGRVHSEERGKMPSASS